MSHDHQDSCADYLERIVYFLDNELDDADVTAVQTHLEVCGPCLARYDLQRTVKALVARSCCEPAPETLRQRVLLSIREVQVQLVDGRLLDAPATDRSFLGDSRSGPGI